MAYNPNVPLEGNRVRSISGDLIAMKENFTILQPLADGYVLSGTSGTGQVQELLLLGGLWVFGASGATGGDDGFIGRGSLPTAQQLAFNVSGDIRAFRKISGQTPTASGHLATKGYVDSVAGATTLNDLSDVNTAGAVSGNALIFSGGNWVPGQASTVATLDDLTDVAVSGAAAGSFLALSGSTWVASGNVMLTDGSKAFTAPVSGVTPSAASHLATKAYVDNLSGLSISGAVTLSGLLDAEPELLIPLADGLFFRYLAASGVWIGYTAGLSDLASVDVTGAISGQVLRFDGTDWLPGYPNISGGVSGVLVSGATSGQALTFNGTNWVPGSAPAATPQSARVHMSSGFAIGNLTTGIAIQWDTEDWDDLGFWDAGDPTHFVIPGGVTAVRFGYGMRSGLATQHKVRIIKNNAAWEVVSGVVTEEVFTPSSTTISGIYGTFGPFLVSSGDVFDLRVDHGSASTSTLSGDVTFFYIEKVR